MSNLKNSLINNTYKIKHFIETTSFCDIYTAIDQTTSKLVNVSIYNASKIGRDDLDEEGILKEIGFLELGIDGFPKLIGFGDFSHELERYRYIATEFISGESVMDRMKRQGPLDEFDALLVTQKIVEIAQNLHNRERPILLNGLSLDNILFDMSDDAESVKLRNLINVRFFDEDYKYTYVDGVQASLLATESFNNVFTPKTDQFNIGALLYQMMTGVLPWYQDSIIDLKNITAIESHLDYRNNQLHFSKVFDVHLKSVIKKTLNVDTEERFRTVGDLNKYLKREKLLITQQEKPKTIKVKSGNGFRDIAGMEELKSQLNTQILDVLKRPEHFKKYGVTIPNGMLLYGPPGCGKSFISEKFCEEAGFNFFLIKPSDLSSIYVSGGEEKIGQLFKEAESNAPTVICFDEVDAIMPKRTTDSNQSISARVNEFLAQLNKCSERGIFVIATTNKPELIDEAMLRTGRLEVKIYVAPPDRTARIQLFQIYLKNRHCEIGLDYEKLADITENVVASDVEFIVNTASHKAAMIDVRISMDILTEVISHFTPSVSIASIESYSIEHQNFADPKNQQNQRNAIGFKKYN
ncbi:MAG: AAA family ATPase [Bacteroidia bacterium]|nr:AAA family ATPase [Bacteroidia bacterium]